MLRYLTGRLLRAVLTIFLVITFAFFVLHLSGDPAMMAGYMGKSDVFDKAVASFGKAYADQAEKDHAAFTRAIREGRIEVQTETDA